MRQPRRQVDQDQLAAWLALVAEADEAAFTALYRATVTQLRGLIMTTVRDHHLTEDTLQQVFVEVWLKAGHYDPQRGKALSWLMMLARRRAIDRVRGEEVARRQLAAHTALIDLVAPAADERVLVSSEHCEVRSALATLTGRQRRSIDMVYYHHRTASSAADELGINLPAFKSRIRGGITQLRRELTRP
ncbi:MULTISPECIES: sigma-70 family RNA polymerase sigma factor [Nocardiaceae]|uniref:RNA polymerase sigma-70 factor (ECF subfamily) n=1 Tax=Williamsia limnetica TaxID=882452 RepID=A0A318RK99_WILLI|nr:sigma-70 family RNA polymerase sigma factor [Williamsia limnetica]PYE11110.1 RNA polymerase sigma-70 factor (ECF subfamily) [Williamsia limnetica]